nr:hypothetical protein [Tanacetum cinerariifolium]
MMTDKESSDVGIDNRPPMLEENDYESWRIRIERYIKGKPLGKLIWKSIKNGPTPHPQTTNPTPEGGVVPPPRNKRDKVFTEEDNKNELADIQAINILSQGLPRRGHDNAFDDDVDEQPVQDLALNVDNVFQADDCDAFDSDVDEAPTAQTMFIANLSSSDPVTDEAGPSYDSDILSEVPDHEHYQDAACAHHKGHVTYDSVQLADVVDSHADYTSGSNMIMYDQYVKDNEVPVVHSDASSVPTDAFMMIYNDMCNLMTNLSLTHHGIQ